MSQQLKWGILGAGNIAKAFAKGVAGSKTGELVAIGSRSAEKAATFGAEFDVPEAGRHGSYDALLADGNVEAVYIATPHPMHLEWIVKAAEAGKHILCEKPITLNYGDAEAAVEAAREHGVFLMEAFMYRCHPQITAMVDVIRSGKIGQVRHIESTFSFNSKPNPDGRLENPELGGGGILDVGCYTTSGARLIAGAAQGQLFAEPTALRALAIKGETGVDLYSCAIAEFPGDITATLTTGIRLNMPAVLKAIGSNGSVELASPWIPARDGGKAQMTVRLHGQEPEFVEIESDSPLYGLEADACAAAIFAGEQQAEPPAMTWNDTLGNMAMLDQWRREIGLEYPHEHPKRHRSVRALPLGGRDGHNMKYGHVPGLDKPVSRFVMGCDNKIHFTDAARLWDDWISRGGNTFDTAHIYGSGRPESVLGQWVEARAIRNQIVLIVKGAHTPHCNPDALASQLLISLERQRTDVADIYIMHRDNPDVPVEEFIDVINEHVDAGRIKVFGGSNWSVERIIAANAYAEKSGKQGFSLLNNNLSLARMVDPVWPGCVASSDAETRAWLEQTGLAHFAWSSQARGFFTDRSAPDKTGIDEQLERCWYSQDNFERKRRAEELAAKRGVSALNIAAAYVLCQPFPSFALIGPRTIHETITSLPALDIELSPEELKWLNLED